MRKDKFSCGNVTWYLLATLGLLSESYSFSILLSDPIRNPKFNFLGLGQECNILVTNTSDWQQQVGGDCSECGWIQNKTKPQKKIDANSSSPLFFLDAKAPNYYIFSSSISHQLGFGGYLLTNNANILQLVLHNVEQGSTPVFFGRIQCSRAAPSSLTFPCSSSLSLSLSLSLPYTTRTMASSLWHCMPVHHFYVWSWVMERVGLAGWLVQAIGKRTCWTRQNSKRTCLFT